MNIEKLENFNIKILQHYNTSRFDNAINCVMPGYFSGNDILFVAQNPGRLKVDVKGDQLFLRAYEGKEYNKLNEHYVQALKSSRGTYGIFINDVYGEDWSRISFTNVFKCPFAENVIPDVIPEFEKKILFKQILLLNPKVIVTVGSIARIVIDNDDTIRSQYKILSMRHPSYLKRTGQYISTVKEYKQQLQKYL